MLEYACRFEAAYLEDAVDRYSDVMFTGSRLHLQFGTPKLLDKKRPEQSQGVRLSYSGCRKPPPESLKPTPGAPALGPPGSNFLISIFSYSGTLVCRTKHRPPARPLARPPPSQNLIKTLLLSFETTCFMSDRFFKKVVLLYVILPVHRRLDDVCDVNV